MRIGRKFAVAAAGTVAAGALAIGIVGSAQAAEPAGPGAACVMVYKARVIADGDLTDAEKGGSVVGYAKVNQQINIRKRGTPRFFGYNVNTGKWGWVLRDKIIDTGERWCE